MAALLGLFVVAVGVGLGNFAAAIGIGFAGVDRRTRIRVGLAFGGFEVFMPLLGLTLGRATAAAAGSTSREIGGVLLILIGLYTVWHARRVEEESLRRVALANRSLVVTAVALSLDNLVVGFALGVYGVLPLLAALEIGVVSVALSLLGLELGGRLGRQLESRSEMLGGVVLVGVGITLITGILA